MTTPEHVARVCKLPRSETPDEGGHYPTCVCRTCGTVTAIIRGKLASRGWHGADLKRVVTRPPTEAASYPYLAAVRVDGAEVYRVVRDLAEATDPDVIADIEAALLRR